MVIYRHKDKYSISEMCRFFEVSRSGYYDYVKRMDVPAWDLPLAEKIRECQEHSRSTYGYRRVHIWLERQGIRKNPKTILRVMQKYNLLSEVRRKKYQNYTNGIYKYPNRLAQDFHADRPNQKWVTDISYIRTGQGFLYLSVIRDLYDNSIVAFKTGTIIGKFRYFLIRSYYNMAVKIGDINLVNQRDCKDKKSSESLAKSRGIYYNIGNQIGTFTVCQNKKG